MLGFMFVLNVAGYAIMRGPAVSAISVPVMFFLTEGFNQHDQDATRRCALEGFVLGAVLGLPVLGVAEAVGGVVLALLCFGQAGFESIVSTAADPSAQAMASFSTRLFREAAVQDPWGALLFAFLSSMLVAGLSEEAFKMGVGASQVLKYRQHKRTLNPVVVMGGVGLGLAFAESMWAISGLRGSTATMLACERVLTSFPIHIFCAIWTARRANTHTSWFLTLLAPAATHGFFDFGIIVCSNYFTRVESLSWSFTAAAATTMAGLKSP